MNRHLGLAAWQERRRIQHKCFPELQGPNNALGVSVPAHRLATQLELQI
jgi:hypothetical protein